MRRLILLLGLSSSLCGGELTPAQRKELVRGLERLEEQQRALDDQIHSLKKLLGADSPLEGLKPLEAEKGMAEGLVAFVEDGRKAYSKGDFDLAKESFQSAWEIDPEHALTNFNLGLAYYKQGNLPLAKRMLKVAVEKHAGLDESGQIAKFLEGDNRQELVTKEPSELDKKRTQLTNLKNEADSYLRSTKLELPRKRAKTFGVLEEMLKVIGEETELIEECYSDIADRYAALEQYQRALDLYKAYETAMQNKLLPDNFYTKQQDVEQRYEALTATLEGYLNNKVEDRNIARRVDRDQEELKIFATQMERFVSQVSEEDGDFKKICKRLRDYRWGGRPGRHVLVVSRHQELLYSSLRGTLPIDRYQDAQGEPFLSNITLLADRLDLKQTELLEVDLKIRGEPVPYLVLYTFIPKHQAFIIVRMPKGDIT